MAGKYDISKRLQRFLLQAKSYLKHQWASVMTSALITYGAFWLETIISLETLEQLVLAIAFTIGAIFIFVVKIPWISLVASLLALCFRCYSHLPLLRHIALAVLIGGCVLSVLDILKHRKK